MSTPPLPRQCQHRPRRRVKVYELASTESDWVLAGDTEWLRRGDVNAVDAVVSTMCFTMAVPWTPRSVARK